MIYSQELQLPCFDTLSLCAAVDTLNAGGDRAALDCITWYLFREAGRFRGGQAEVSRMAQPIGKLAKDTL